MRARTPRPSRCKAARRATTLMGAVAAARPRGLTGPRAAPALARRITRSSKLDSLIRLGYLSSPLRGTQGVW